MPSGIINSDSDDKIDWIIVYLTKLAGDRTGRISALGLFWKNIANFKRAILIGSQLGVYSHLILNKTEGTENWKKKKRNLLCESKLF